MSKKNRHKKSASSNAQKSNNAAKEEQTTLSLDDDNKNEVKESPEEAALDTAGTLWEGEDYPAGVPEETIDGAAEAAMSAAEGTEAVAEDNIMVPASALAEAEKQRDEYLELARRTQAELENFRKRVIRDRENDKLLSKAALLRAILSPVDDLDRALAESEKSQDFKTLFEGLTMVRTTLWKELENEGFGLIDAAPGTEFDPNFHEAMMQMPHEEIPQGAIVQELSAGYRLGDLVLRASRVAVSAGKPQ